MLTSTTSTMLRPGFAVATRSSAGVVAKPAAFLLRRPTAACACGAAAGQVAVRAMHSQPRTAPTPLAPSAAPCLKRKLSTPPLSTPSSQMAAKRSLSTTAAALARSPEPLANRSGSQRDAASDAAAAAAVSQSQQAAHPELPALDWNTFFQLRKTRRRIQVAFSVAGGLTGGMMGGLFLGSGVAEPVVAQVPLDPFFTLGLMTFGFATLGWLVGPSIGNVVFYAWKRQYKAQMTLKETQFFARIKKNRVDPSASSAGNPVPDFYGEKISSVAGYRQWLKDQRAFNKKRTTFV